MNKIKRGYFCFESILELPLPFLEFFNYVKQELLLVLMKIACSKTVHLLFLEDPGATRVQI